MMTQKMVERWLSRAVGLLGDTLSKWHDEEESVQEEKRDHIAELEQFFKDWERKTPPVEVTPALVTRLEKFDRLRDGLFDMIQKERLTDTDLPEDFEWLEQMLEETKP